MRPKLRWLLRACAWLGLCVCATSRAQQARTLVDLTFEGMGASSGIHRLDDVTVRQPGEWPRVRFLGDDRVVVWFQPVEGSALRRRDEAEAGRTTRVQVFDLAGRLLARRDLRAETLRLWPVKDGLVAQVTGRTQIWNTDLSLRGELEDAPVTTIVRPVAGVPGGPGSGLRTTVHLGQPLLLAPDGSWVAWQAGEAFNPALRVTPVAAPHQRSEVRLEGAGLITAAGKGSLIRLMQVEAGKPELMPLAVLPCAGAEFTDRAGKPIVWARDRQWRVSACAEPIAFAGKEAAVWLVDSGRHGAPAIEVVKRSGEVLLAAPLPARQSASVCGGDALGSWVAVCVFRPMLSRSSRYAETSVEQVIKLDVATGAVWRKKLPMLSAAAFSADGKRLAWIEGTQLKIADVP